MIVQIIRNIGITSSNLKITRQLEKNLKTFIFKMLNQALSSMLITYTRYTTYQNLLQRKVNTMFADFSSQKVGKF